MTIIHARDSRLRAENKPVWYQTPAAGYFRMSREGGTHDCHYHDYNELYLICRGKAEILNDDQEYSVKAHDIVCIKAGDEHDFLEIYGDEDFELFWLYEAGPENGRWGHLHRIRFQ